MTHERSDVKPLAVSSCSESTAYILLRLMGLPRLTGAALVAAALVAGCGSSDSNPGGAGRTDGGNGSTNSGPLPEGGGPDSTSLSNLDGSAGSSNSGLIDARPIDDSLLDASGSASVGDGATGANADGSSSRDDSEADVPATFFVRYEAESAMNTRSFPVEGVVTDGAQPCSGVPGTSSDGVKAEPSLAGKSVPRCWLVISSFNTRVIPNDGVEGASTGLVKSPHPSGGGITWSDEPTTNH